MAGKLCRFVRPCSHLCQLKEGPLHARAITTSSYRLDKEGKKSWSDILWRTATANQIDPYKDAHSRLLADKTNVYEFMYHDVKPVCVEDYKKSYNDYVEKMHDLEGHPCRLIGSWMVDVGDQDQAIHIWEYPDYKTVSAVRALERKTPDVWTMKMSRIPMIRRRVSQLCLSFSFWGEIKPRAGENLYELRSYILKPGTMIEWGNNWARGIKYRQRHQEAVAGFFAQIGQLYNVHHLFAYRDLNDRKMTRELAWSQPGWDEVVSYTVPLMRSVEARIMVPNEFSPLQ